MTLHGPQTKVNLLGNRRRQLQGYKRLPRPNQAQQGVVLLYQVVRRLNCEGRLRGAEITFEAIAFTCVWGNMPTAPLACQAFCRCTFAVLVVQITTTSL
jgi:hypothetical protein